uniref:Uncharacterized protein n=2 Tax=Triticum urartu TaxID=4572 RepID=A0A8R7PQZ4_TRIUA
MRKRFSSASSHLATKRRRRGAPAPSRPPRPSDLCRIREYMLLLFETPSGFAVFLFCGSLINPPRSLEDIWLNFADSNTAKGVVLLMEFQTFEDKSSAINQNTGVSERLADMIRAWLPGKKMAVGKPEYKEIIEERLEIECLYNKRVMEVMWGIQNCMPGLIPIEKSQLAKEDRLPSKGLQKFLKCYDCNVKPEMVNEQIVATASALSECDSVEMKYSVVMREAGAVIKDVSGISCEGWSLLDIATALKMIWKPKKVGNSSLVSKDEALRLVNDASKYEALVNKHAYFFPRKRKRPLRFISLTKKC